MAEIVPQTPIDIPTSATVSFIEAYVPSGGKILEVGCGSGHVAARLAKHGYDVIGIDSDEQAISQSKKRGVRVVTGTWPHCNVEMVDAVLFTRSLHHMPDLPDAISKIQEVLEPNGMVLIEDFAFNEAEPAAIAWLLKIAKSQQVQALMSPDSDSFIAMLLSSNDPLQAWHQDHDHDLHSSVAMTQAIRGRFSICETQRVPYLYRYLVDAFAETSEATSCIEEIFNTELHLGSVGAFSLIGHRIVASEPR